VHSASLGIARVPAGRYAPVRDTGAQCGRAHATPGVVAGLQVRSVDSLTDLKTGAAAGSPIGMTRQGARHVRNIYVLSDNSVGILVNAHGHA
jgi:hypothetical protein